MHAGGDGREWAWRWVAIALALGPAPGCAEVAGIESWEPRSGGSGAAAGASASSASAGGGASTGTAGATASSGSGGSGGEDCVNGIDDDGDGKTDCTDESCSAWSCVPHVAGAEYVFVSSDSTCPPGFTAKALDTCDGCGCGSTADCVLSGALYDGPLCMSAAPKQIGGNQCGDASYTAPVEITAMATVTLSGSPLCTPQDDSTKPTVCVAAPPSSFECEPAHACVPVEATCVLVEGTTCPVGWDVRTAVYESSPDVCGCACTGTTFCDLYWLLGTSMVCSAVGATLPADGACHDTGVDQSFVFLPPDPIYDCTATSAPRAPERSLCCP